MAMVTTALIKEPKKIKSVTVSTVSPSICHEVMGPDAMIFVFCLGIGNDQGGLVCSSPWGRKESDIIERLN